MVLVELVFFLHVRRREFSLIRRQLLLRIELWILVYYIIGIRYFFEYVNQWFFSSLFDFLSCQFTHGNILLNLFDQLLKTTSNEILQLFYVNEKLLRDVKSLVVPALFFKYSIAIKISHLLKLNLLPWISFLGNGVSECANTMLNLLSNAICFDWDPCWVRLPAW